MASKTLIDIGYLIYLETIRSETEAIKKSSEIRYSFGFLHELHKEYIVHISMAWAQSFKGIRKGDVQRICCNKNTRPAPDDEGKIIFLIF